MRPEEIQNLTQGCINGEPAACMAACPLQMDIRAFTAAVRDKRWIAAYRIMRDAMLFPDLVSGLCGGICEDHCVLKDVSDPVRINLLERTVIQEAGKRPPKKYRLPAKNKSVAVIGAGICGLACAAILAIRKYDVVVYDRRSTFGGALLGSEQEALLSDVSYQLQYEKIEYRFGEEIADLSSLQADAVMIATGNGGSTFGETLQNHSTGVFLGGGCTGSRGIQSVAEGIRAAADIEHYFLTGKMPENTAKPVKAVCYHPDTESAAASFLQEGTASPDSDAAMSEAGRCLQCDCSRCLEECEMLSYYERTPKQITKGIIQDTMAGSTVSKRIMTRQIASCNLCGQCTAVCPNEVDIGGVMLLARQDRVKSGSVIPAFHDFWMRQMDFYSEEGAVYIPPVSQGQIFRTPYLFFPGCQLGASNPDYVLLPFESLRNTFGAGLFVTCCGAPAYWAGEEERHRKWTETLRKQWEDSGQPVMILGCASCEKQFRQFLPEIKTVSLYEILEAGMRKQSEISDPDCSILSSAMVFDPCSAREDNILKDSVRKLAASVGCRITEPAPHSGNAKCCGWGGHIQAADPALYDRIVADRISESDQPYIVYCANCRDVFAAKGKQAAHILDLVYHLDDGTRKAPTIREKREQSLNLKKRLLSDYLNIVRNEGGAEDDLILTVSEELSDLMERMLISEDEVHAVLREAVRTGDYVIDQGSGIRYASKEFGYIVIWIGFKEEENHRFVLDAVYTHRLKLIGKGDGE